MISSRLPAEYMAGIAPERLAEQWIPSDQELRALDRFPDFLAARRSLLANVLNELLGLPAYDGRAVRQDADEMPADETVIAEDTSAPALVKADVQALRTEQGIELHAVYEGLLHHRLLRSAVPHRDDPLRPGPRCVRIPQRGGSGHGSGPQPARQSEPQRVVVLDRHDHGGAPAKHPVKSGSNGRVRCLPPGHR